MLRAVFFWVSSTVAVEVYKDAVGLLTDHAPQTGGDHMRDEGTPLLAPAHGPLKVNPPGHAEIRLDDADPSDGLRNRYSMAEKGEDVHPPGHAEIRLGDADPSNGLRDAEKGEDVPLKQTAKRGTEDQWAEMTKSWEGDGISRELYGDDAAMAVIKDVLPADLYEKVKTFRNPVEKADIFRLAVLYRDGGVYADMDQRLLDKAKLMKLWSSGKCIFPLEKSFLIGQSFMLCQAGHPFLMALMQQFVEHYDPACYVVDNTGPDAVIDFFRSSGGCGRWAKEGVVLTADLFEGSSPVSRHERTGTWRHHKDHKEMKARKHPGYPCPGPAKAPHNHLRDLASCTQSAAEIVAGDAVSFARQQTKLRLSQVLTSASDEWMREADE